MDTLLQYAKYAAYVIAGLVVILNGIAPLTLRTGQQGACGPAMD